MGSFSCWFGVWRRGSFGGRRRKAGCYGVVLREISPETWRKEAEMQRNDGLNEKEGEERVVRGREGVGGGLPENVISLVSEWLNADERV